MNRNTPKIELFSYPTSPYGQKVGCYLKFKNLNFDFIPVNPTTNAEIKFTHQTQVPVLRIDGEWRKESSELGLWLNNLFPDIPILPSSSAERENVLAVDRWISDSLIPSMFRRAVEWENTFNSIHNGWLLARAVSNATPLPWHLRLLWPWGVKRAPFIVNMVNQLDLQEPIADMNARLISEFEQHIGDGPFFAQQKQPSLADLSAYPIVISHYLVGMKINHSLLNSPKILKWARQVQTYLPNNPLLVPDHLIKRVHP